MLIQEGGKEGILIGQATGKLEDKLAIDQFMLLKAYSIEDIMLLDGLYRIDMQYILYIIEIYNNQD